MAWRRGFDGRLKIPQDQNDASEDGVLADLAEKINGGIQRCIQIDTNVCTAVNSVFTVKIESILPEAESESRDLLTFLFGAKYCQFSASFGVKLNGRPRGVKTLIEINKVTHRKFSSLDLKSAWSDLQIRKLPRIEKLVLGLDDATINRKRWRNVNPKKLKTLIGSQEAMIKEFQFEANDDKKQIVNLEVELTTNVDTIEDLMRKITNSEQEINLLKYELSIQSQSNTKAHELMKTLHAREVGRLKIEIKNKSNEIRKLKISRAMRKSKKNAIIQNKRENDDDSDDDFMDNKESSRAVKSVMDILKLESKQSTKKRLTIIKKIAKKIECEKILDSTTEIENDVGQSIIKFSRIIWKFVSNENIKKILNTFLLAAVTYSETSIN